MTPLEQCATLSPTCPNCGTEIMGQVVPRTERQAEILHYVIDFEQRKGHRPSYALIARHFGFSSRSSVVKHIRSLERQGFLKTA